MLLRTASPCPAESAPWSALTPLTCPAHCGRPGLPACPALQEPRS